MSSKTTWDEQKCFHRWEMFSAGIKLLKESLKNNAYSLGACPFPKWQVHIKESNRNSSGQLRFSENLNNIFFWWRNCFEIFQEWCYYFLIYFILHTTSGCHAFSVLRFFMIEVSLTSKYVINLSVLHESWVFYLFNSIIT